MTKNKAPFEPKSVLLVAVPETAGSSLYGMLDVLSATGNIWQTLTRSGRDETLFKVRVVSNADRPFTCGNGIPVQPDCSIAEDPRADLIIVPGIVARARRIDRGTLC